MDNAVTLHHHAALWIDHHEAHIVYFNTDDMEEHVVHAPKSSQHIHSKAGSASGTHLHGNAEFFGQVADMLAPARSILILGPSEAKSEFVAFLDRQGLGVRKAIAGIRGAQQMTDRQLVAEARRFFKASDRLNPVSDLTAGKGAGTH